MSVIFGPDISNVNGRMSLDQIRAEGFEFCWFKVSEGGGFRDQLWPAYRDWCVRENFPFAGYHFYRSGDGPAANADCYASWVGDPGIPCMIDWEDNYANSSIGEFWQFVNELNARGIEARLAYIPRWYWQGHMGSPDLSGLAKGGISLIQSSYVSGSGYASAMYPGNDWHGWSGFGGKDVDILQFTDAAVIAGRRVDCNAFRGTVDQLRGLLRGQNVDTQGGLDMDAVKHITDFIKGFNSPIGSDVKDVRQQITGGRDAGEYPGWPQGGNRTLYDLMSAIGEKMGVPGCYDTHDASEYEGK